MEGQGWNKEQKYQDDAQFDEKQQDQSPELSFVDFKETRRPGDAGIPKHVRRDKIKQGECNADNKCAQEKVPEENDFFAFHATHYLFQKSRINNKQRGGRLPSPSAHIPN